MLPLPRTPSKADDGIERVKQSLSTRWGIRFPVRHATPSKRNKTLVEEKILDLIQFLYFKEGALDHAIGQFERNAPQIVSHWQFKPHGESDVLPSLAHAESALKQDFLKKRHDLLPQAVTELTESLKDFLRNVADRVKAGERFPRPVKDEGKNSYLPSTTLPSSLKMFQMSQLPRMSSRLPSLTCRNTSRASRNGCERRANRDQQRAETHQLSTPPLTTTQTTK